MNNLHVYAYFIISNGVLRESEHARYWLVLDLVFKSEILIKWSTIELSLYSMHARLVEVNTNSSALTWYFVLELVFGGQRYAYYELALGWRNEFLWSWWFHNFVLFIRPFYPHGGWSNLLKFNKKAYFRGYLGVTRGWDLSAASLRLVDLLGLTLRRLRRIRDWSFLAVWDNFFSQRSRLDGLWEVVHVGLKGLIQNLLELGQLKSWGSSNDCCLRDSLELSAALELIWRSWGWDLLHLIGCLHNLVLKIDYNSNQFLGF